MRILLQALYFMLPAYFANMAPAIFKWVPFGGSPVDGGRVWKGNRLFGNHKTYRGLVSGIFLAVIVVFAQRAFPWEGISILRYENLSIGISVLAGILFGAGALGGDLIKSFFKRRLGIEDGKLWFPFDQLDFVIGSLAAMSFIYFPPLLHVLIIIVITPILHFLTNVTAYFLKIKKVWW